MTKYQWIIILALIRTVITIVNKIENVNYNIFSSKEREDINILEEAEIQSK